MFGPHHGLDAVALCGVTLRFERQTSGTRRWKGLCAGERMNYDIADVTADLCTCSSRMRCTCRPWMLRGSLYTARPSRQHRSLMVGGAAVPLDPLSPSL